MNKALIIFILLLQLFTVFGMLYIIVISEGEWYFKLFFFLAFIFIGALGFKVLIKTLYD